MKMTPKNLTTEELRARLTDCDERLRRLVAQEKRLEALVDEATAADDVGTAADCAFIAATSVQNARLQCAVRRRAQRVVIALYSRGEVPA